MSKIVTVLDRQSIWDLAVQHYGSVEGVKQLILDNPTKLNFENSIPLGTKIIITQNPINNKIYTYFSSKKINPTTAVDVPMNSTWILATGTWNDNGFWEDNALWID